MTALFDFWIEEPQELPSGYVEEIQTEGLARVVADYIAGMTDTFILLQYAQIKTASAAAIEKGLTADRLRLNRSRVHAYDGDAHKVGYFFASNCQ